MDDIRTVFKVTVDDIRNRIQGDRGRYKKQYSRRQRTLYEIGSKETADDIMLPFTNSMILGIGTGCMLAAIKIQI